MKLLLDMNLPPDWVTWLAGEGFDVVHWSAVGDPRATDAQIMSWAATNGRWVVTHDLDFGTILAVTRATGPSVIQLRAQDVLSARVRVQLSYVLRNFAGQLTSGALIVIDSGRNRLRLLPIHP